MDVMVKLLTTEIPLDTKDDNTSIIKHENILFHLFEMSGKNVSGTSRLPFPGEEKAKNSAPLAARPGND